MQRPPSFLAGLTPEDFLSQYWQKQPLKCPGALTDYVPPVTADELAGLACEDEVESRIVLLSEGHWQLATGPFGEETFESLPHSQWTLLVQDLDQHVSEVGELLELLDFLPSWRIDDVMASFAAPGGSVGPHYDHYDVFLLQVSGKRRWQWTSHFDRKARIEDAELNLLSSFEPEEEWELGPGDMLYLPPHVAHYGVASGPCVTYSLGCRAPSLSDMVAHAAHTLMSELDDGVRYTDRDRAPVRSQYRLDNASLSQARQLLEEHLTLSERQLAVSFGCLVTEPKALFALDPMPLSQSRAERSIKYAKKLVKAKGSRWLDYVSKDEALLFANGQCFTFPPAAAKLTELLCTRREFSVSELSEWLELPEVETRLVELVQAELLETNSA